MQTYPDRWRVFIGYLAESTTYRNQRTFRIYVPETLPALTGDVTPEVATHTVKIPNVMTNKTEESNVDVATTIIAEYLGVLTSRTVPTMYKNQQVLVINFANDDSFFWIPLERDDYLRTFEQIRFSALDQAITNKSTATGKDVEAKQASITDDNSYYFEIDTKYNKHIFFSTAATDGEAWRYFFKIDANTKSVEIWDQSIQDPSIPSNSITLESQPIPGCKGRIKLETAAGASLTLEDKNAMLHIPGNMELFIGGNLVTNVNGTTTSSFVGAVGTTITGQHIHNSVGDVVHNYSSNLGVAVTMAYTLSVKGPIVTSTLTSAMHQQPIRTVITEGVDTINSATSIITTGYANWTAGSTGDVYVLEIPSVGRVACNCVSII